MDGPKHHDAAGEREGSRGKQSCARASRASSGAAAAARVASREERKEGLG